MARRRHVAPARGQVAAERFEAPPFAGCRAHLDWLRSAEWPPVAALDARLGGRRHPHSGRTLRFVAQDEALSSDGLHYERRIFERGLIATRERNWHDLFNALAWIEHPALKAALNARQAADIARVGERVRTRGQCALTHFDEAGALVLLRDPRLLAAWDVHDWARVFDPAPWSRGDCRLLLFGHALLEHALGAAPLPTAKCLVVLAAGDAGGLRQAETAVAAAIAAGALLVDPQELRPLPLDGVPGWHPAQGTPAFLARDCFRPLRPGRRYPAPWPLR